MKTDQDVSSIPKEKFDENNLQGFITRNINTGLFQFAAYAKHEELIRTQALYNIESPILKYLDNPSLFYPVKEKSEQYLFVLVHDTAEKELIELHKTASPIGKAGLPRWMGMWEHKGVLKLVAAGKYTEAMYLFKDEFVRTAHLSDPMLDKLKYGNWALGVSSAALTAYQISKSDDQLAEIGHQAILLGTGFVGGIKTGTLSVVPCGFVGVAAPVCVAGATFVGGILGTEIGEYFFQQGKKLKSYIRHLNLDKEELSNGFPSIIREASASQFSRPISRKEEFMPFSEPIVNKEAIKNYIKNQKADAAIESDEENLDYDIAHTVELEASPKTDTNDFFQAGELPAETLQENQIFLETWGLPFTLSEDIVANRAMHYRLNGVLKHYEQQMAEQKTLEQFKAAHDMFGAIGSIGRYFHQKDLQTIQILGQTGISVFMSIGKLTGSFGFTQVAGFAAIGPVAGIVTAGFGLMSYLSSLDEEEEADNQLAIAVNILIAQLRAMQEYISYRSDRLENILESGFSQTSKQLQQVHNTIITSFKYLQVSVALKTDELSFLLKEALNDLVRVGQENLLKELNEVISITQRNSMLTYAELSYVLSHTETYLHKHASNPALTYALIGDLNKQAPPTAFQFDEIKSYLSGKDVFNKLGYLKQYEDWKTQGKITATKIANPYVWLMAFNNYVKVIYKNFNSHPVARIDRHKVKELSAPAKEALKLFKVARSQEFLRKLIAEHESNEGALKQFINEHFDVYNKNYSLVTIDIRQDITHLIKNNPHSIDFKPATPKASLAPLESKIPSIYRRIFSDKVSSLDISEIYQKMVKENHCHIPAEFIISEKLKKGIIESHINFYYELIDGGHNIKSEYDLLITYKNYGDETLPVKILTVSSSIVSSNSLFVWKLLTKRPEYTISARQTNTPIITTHFFKSTFHQCNLLNVDDYTMSLRSKIETSLLIEARKNFGKSFIDPLSEIHPKFIVLKDELNKSFLLLSSFLKIAGLNFTDLNFTFYTGNDAQSILYHLHETGDLQALNFFLQDDQSLYKAKEIILEQARRAEEPPFESTNHLERMLQMAINYLNETSILIESRNNRQKTSKSKKTDESAGMPELLDKARHCEDETIMAVIEDTPDLDILDEAGNSAIELALLCSNNRKRNRLLIQLIESRAYQCRDPVYVAGILTDILEKSHAVFSEKDYTRLEKAYHRFNKHHHIDTHQQPAASSFFGIPFASAEPILTKPKDHSSNGFYAWISSIREVISRSMSQFIFHKSEKPASVVMSCEMRNDSSMLCSTTSGTVQVFPKPSTDTGIVVLNHQPPNHASSAKDTFNIKSCRPVEFGGYPSVYCEGESNTIIYTPRLPLPLFVYVDGNLMLGRVIYYSMRQLINSLSKSTINPEPTTIQSPKLPVRLRWIKNTLAALERQLLQYSTDERNRLNFVLTEQKEIFCEIIKAKWIDERALEELFYDVRTLKKEFSEQLAQRQQTVVVKPPVTIRPLSMFFALPSRITAYQDNIVQNLALIWSTLVHAVYPGNLSSMKWPKSSKHNSQHMGFTQEDQPSIKPLMYHSSTAPNITLFSSNTAKNNPDRLSAYSALKN